MSAFLRKCTLELANYNFLLFETLGTMLLSVALPKLKDVKGSNADISHGPHQRISCQFSDSAPSHQFTTMPRRLPLPRCTTVWFPTVIPNTYKDNTYFKCLRVLCRDTQKHQQQNPGHVCVPKTSAEPRALTRSKIPIPLISQSRNWMVRVSATINLPTTT